MVVHLPPRRRGGFLEAVLQQAAEARQKPPAIGWRKLPPRRGRLAGGYGRGELLLGTTLPSLLSFGYVGDFELLYQRQEPEQPLEANDRTVCVRLAGGHKA